MEILELISKEMITSEEYELITIENEKNSSCDDWGDWDCDCDCDCLYSPCNCDD